MNLEEAKEQIEASNSADCEVDGINFIIKNYFNMGDYHKLIKLLEGEALDDAALCSKIILILVKNHTEEEIQRLELTEEQQLQILIAFAELQEGSDEEKHYVDFINDPSFLLFRNVICDKIKAYKESLQPPLSLFGKLTNQLNKPVSILGTTSPTIKRFFNSRPNTPKVTICDPNIEKRSKENFLDEINQKDTLPKIEKGDSCSICGAKVYDKHFWFYEAYCDDKVLLACSNDCMTKLNEQHSNIRHIDEITRCSAYFKCKSISNLRNMCQKSEVKVGTVSKFNFSFKSRNFCAPADAGLIMSSHKNIKVLADFHATSEANHKALMDFVGEADNKSTNQAKLTLGLTIFIIFLTIVNVGVACVPLFNDNSKSQLEQFLRESNPFLYCFLDLYQFA